MHFQILWSGRLHEGLSEVKEPVCGYWGDSIPLDANAVQGVWNVPGIPGQWVLLQPTDWGRKEGRKPISSQTIALRTLVSLGMYLQVNRSRT